MKYSLGDSMADYGFSFLEKLHSPIFLLHRNGQLKKVNEAGRKLLSVAHVTSWQLDELIGTLVQLDLGPHKVDYKVFGTKWKKIKVVSKPLECSDYMLVELIR